MSTIIRPKLMLLLVGVAAGFMSGLFGVGGGILVVPGLVMIAKMDQRLAHGTSLAAVLPIAASSLLSYWVNSHVDWPVAACLSVGAIVGAYIGAELLAIIAHRTLSLVFAAILVAAGIRLFFAIDGNGRASLTIFAVSALILVGVITGVLAGLLGVGGGIVMVPVMAVFFGIPPAVAKGTSLAVIIPTALVGTYRNRKNSNADLKSALIIGITGIVFAVVGSWVSVHMSDSLSNFLFALLLIGVAIRMFIQSRQLLTVEDSATAIAE